MVHLYTLTNAELMQPVTGAVGKTINDLLGAIENANAAGGTNYRLLVLLY